MLYRRRLNAECYNIKYNDHAVLHLMEYVQYVNAIMSTFRPNYADAIWPVSHTPAFNSPMLTSSARQLILKIDLCGRRSTKWVS